MHHCVGLVINSSELANGYIRNSLIYILTDFANYSREMPKLWHKTRPMVAGNLDIISGLRVIFFRYGSSKKMSKV